MNVPFIELSSAKKLENSIFFAILFLVFKIIFLIEDSFIFLVANELILFGSLYFLMLYLMDYIQFRITVPLSIILNAGILTALIFFFITLADIVFDPGEKFIVYSNFFNSIIYTLLFFVLAASVAYIFIVLRGLFFLRQKRDPRKYFNLMTWFILLASFSMIIVEIDGNLNWIFYGFYFVAILLIILNSLRVGWIAFLTKKQKIYLLVISIVLSFLCGFNYGLSFDVSPFRSMLLQFSPSFIAFMNLVMLYGSIFFGVIFFTTLFHLPTAEAFDRKEEEVSSLIDLGKLITQVFDYKELAQTITQITMKVSNSECAWLAAEVEDKPEIISMVNIGYVEASRIMEEINLKEFAGVKGVHIITQSGVLLRNRAGQQYRSIAVAPLRIHNEINGYLFTARSSDLQFDEDDKRNIGAYAQYAALAMENSKLIKESIEKERLEKELDVAREIQYKILPTETPETKGVEIAALFIPAFEVGGDYYDFFELDENRLGFVIADVSGKGISAAFVMAEVKGIFESLSRLISDPAELLVKANQVLSDSLDAKTFVTAIYGILDKNDGTLKFARAGHNPLLIARGGKVEKFTPPGIGLGLDHGLSFGDAIKVVETRLESNDLLILYTDGITESQNEHMDEFGYERFCTVIEENHESTINELSNEIIKKVSTFSKGMPQHDDITLVIFRRVFNQ